MDAKMDFLQRRAATQLLDLEKAGRSIAELNQPRNPRLGSQQDSVSISQLSINLRIEMTNPPKK